MSFIKRLVAMSRRSVLRRSQAIDAAIRPVVESLEARQLLSISLPQGLALNATDAQTLQLQFENAGASQEQVDSWLAPWATPPQIISAHSPAISGTTAGGGLDRGQQQSNSVQYSYDQVVTFMSNDTWAMYAREWATQPDGKVVVVGQGLPLQGNSGYFPSFGLVARFNPDGTLDGSFAYDGLLNLQYGGCLDQIALANDGSILVAGTLRDIELVNEPPYIPNFVPYQQVVRMDADGRNWQYFQSNCSDRREGYDDVDNPCPAIGLGFDSSGRILVAYTHSGSNSYGNDVVRYANCGAIDYSFGYGRLGLDTGSAEVSLDSPTVSDTGMATVSGTLSGAGTLAHSVLLDWGDGNSQEISLAANTSDFTATHAYALEGDWRPEAIAYDGSSNPAASGAASLTVDAVGPYVADLEASQNSISEGGTVTLSGTIADARPWEATLAHSVAVDWGDGQTSSISVDRGTMTFEGLTHQYADQPSSNCYYEASVSVSDGGEGTPVGTRSVDIFVENASPSLSISGDYTVGEGADYSVSLSSTDPGDDHITLWNIDWGDGSSASLQDASGTLTHAYADGPTYHAITATAFDEDGSYSTSAWVSVSNVAPTAGFANLPSYVTEGNEIWATATATDAPADTSAGISFSWVVMDGEQTAASGWGSEIHFTPYRYGDYGVYLTATDKEGFTSDVATATVEVANVAPWLSLAWTPTIAESSDVTLSGTISDPGMLDVQTLSIDWGDNSGTLVTLGTSATSFGAISHWYADNQPNDAPFTIHVSVSDGLAETTTDALVTVTNVAPQVSITGAPQTGTEGTALSFSATASDPGTLDSVTYSWTVRKSDDSPYPLPEGTSTDQSGFTFTPSDDGVYLVAIQAMDGDEAFSSATATISVSNAAPSDLSLTLDSATINEAGTTTLSGSFTDPGTLDNHTISIDWGDQQSEQLTLSAGTLSFSGVTHTYADNLSGDAPYTVHVTASDNLGSYTTASVDATVQNGAPSILDLTLSSTAIAEGGSTTLSGSFTDLGMLDGHTVSIDWGDNQSDQVTLLAGTLSFSGVSHTYANNLIGDAPYTVHVTAADNDGAYTSTDASVTVADVAPELTLLTAPTDGVEGTSLAFSATASDAGTLDSLTYSWSVEKDGTSYALPNGAATDQPAFTFTPTDNGTYVVYAGVTDDDELYAVTETTVSVANVAPSGLSLTLSSGTIDETGTVTLTGSFADPGAADTHTVHVNWGDSGVLELPTNRSLDIASGVTLTKTGTGTLTIDGSLTHGSGAALVVAGGRVNFGSDAGGLPVIVNNGATASYNTTQTAGPLQIGSASMIGTAHIGGSATVLTVHSLGLSLQGSGSALDVGSGTLVIDWSDAGATPAAAIRSMLTSGYANGAWNGGGINSSTAHNHVGTAVGYSDNSATHKLTAKYTWGGDANLDRTVNFDDLSALAQHYNQTSGQTWQTGDFNYDGRVNFDDLSALAQHYNSTSSTLPAGNSAYRMGENDTGAGELDGPFARELTQDELDQLESEFGSDYVELVEDAFAQTAGERYAGSGLLPTDEEGLGGDLSLGGLRGSRSTNMALGENGVLSIGGSEVLNLGDGLPTGTTTISLEGGRAFLGQGVITLGSSIQVTGDSSIAIFGPPDTAISLSAGTLGFSLTHTYGDSGTRGITVTVADDDGDSTDGATEVTVNDLAPAVSIASGPTTGTEGEPLTYTATASDPSDVDAGAGFTYAWTVTENEQTIATGEGAQFTFTPDDNGTYEVGVVAHDKDGQSAPANLTVTVANAAPAGLSLTLSSGSISEGEVTALSGSFTDPGTLDVHLISIDWGDGWTDEVPLDAGTFTFDGLVHTYPDAGNYTLTASFSDADGGTASTTAGVSVTNVAPTADLGGDRTVSEGGELWFGDGIFDPGWGDSLTFTWHVTSDNSQTLADGHDADFSFTPEDEGAYSLTVTVEDGHGATASDSIAITVQDVAPQLTLTGPDALYENESYSLTLASSDVGTEQVTAWTLDWGDGTTETFDGGTSLATHTYVSAGFYEIAATGVDSDERGFQADAVAAQVFPSTAPAPTQLTVTPTGNGVFLSWQSSPGATSYTVKRTNADGSIISWPAVDTTATDDSATGLCSYVVEAVNSNGIGAVSQAVQVAISNFAPGAVGGVMATPDASAPRIVVNWDSVPTARGYNIYRGVAGFHLSQGVQRTAIAPYGYVATGAPNFTDEDLDYGTTYWYSVTAVFADREGPQWAVVPATTLPAAPAHLVTHNSASHASLTWDASPGATGYNVYCLVGQTGNTATVATTTDTSASIWLYDASLQLMASEYSEFTFYVTAENAAGHSTASNTALAERVPEVPGDPAAEPLRNGIAITWSESDGAAYYVLYRATVPYDAQTQEYGEPGAFTQYAIALGTEFADTNIDSDTRYAYRVAAANSAGDSAESGIEEATTYPAAPTQLHANSDASSITLAWASAGPDMTYEVYRSTDGGAPTQIFAPGNAPITATSHTDGSAEVGHAYKYYVKAVNETGDSAESKQVEAALFCQPAVPDNVAAAAAVVSGWQGVKVTWTRSPGAQFYDIYTSPTPGIQGSWQYTATVPDSSYFDASANNASTVYYYRVQARNAAGSSNYSAIVSASGALTPTQPIARNDWYSWSAGSSLHVTAGQSDGSRSIGLRDNDTDCTSYQTVAGPMFGSLELETNGDFTYTPNPGFVGIDRFLYVASDGTRSSNVTSVILDINGEPQIAPDLLFQGMAAQNVTGSTTNCALSPISGSVSMSGFTSYVVVTGPANGTFNSFDEETGAFVYVPGSSMSHGGNDSFTYRAYSGGVATAPATAAIRIGSQQIVWPEGGGGPPISISPDPAAVPIDPYHTGTATYYAAHGTDQLLTLTQGAGSFNSNSLTAVIDATEGYQPSGGSFTDNQDGTFTYHASANFWGWDRFTYRLTDGTQTSEPITGLVRVTNVLPRVSGPLTWSVSMDNPLTVAATEGLLTNLHVTGGDNDDLSIAPLDAWMQPLHGKVTVNADGSFNYKPNRWFVGRDVFSYRVSDGVVPASSGAAQTLLGGTDIGTVEIEVTGIPSEPDVDVDSDNDSGAGIPDRSTSEDQIEDYADQSGKIVFVNDNDDDNDGVPDLADGFSPTGAASPTTNESFTPVVISLPDAIDPDAATLTLTYNASYPDSVTAGTGNYAPLPIHVDSGSPGQIRLWTRYFTDSGGTLTWLPRSSADIGCEQNPSSSIGYFAAPGTYTGDALRNLGFGSGQTSVTLYVEGITPSAALGDSTIAFSIDPEGDETLTFSDQVRLTVMKADLHVDSDNSGTIAAEGSTAALLQDQIEAATTLNASSGTLALPGKYVVVNDGDDDHDAIPGWADGFDWDRVAATMAGNSDSGAASRMVPIVITLPASVDVTKARLKIRYNGSNVTGWTDAYADPEVVGRSAPPAANGWFTYSLPGLPTGRTDHIRLWTGTGDRTTASFIQKTSGDTNAYYVPPNSHDSRGGPGPDEEYYDAQDLAKLGFTTSNRSVTLYIEGIRPSTALAQESISVEVDPDGAGPAGFMLKDEVRLTVIKADIQADSDNDGSQAAVDDQIEHLAPEQHLGAFVPVNAGDADHDGIPDWADGFGVLDGKDVSQAVQQLGQANAGAPLVPITITLSDAIDLSKASFQILYDAADPAAVQALGDGTTASPFRFVNTSSGHLRLWTKIDNRHFISFEGADTESGDDGWYVPQSDDGYSGSALSALFAGSRTLTLYVEGIRPTAGDEGRIDISVDPLGGTNFIALDSVQMCVTGPDLKIDSDNDGSVGDPASYDDQIEDYTATTSATVREVALPGKYVPVDDVDTDSDAIPDWADGFDWDGLAENSTRPSDATNAGAHFVPLTVTIPGNIDLNTAWIKLTYSGSDPGKVTRTGSGTLADPYRYALPVGGGALRLWTKDAADSRTSRSILSENNPALGYYLAPTASNGFYLASILDRARVATGSDQFKLYIEGLSPSSSLADQEIAIQLDPDGPGPAGFESFTDAVRLTLFGASLHIDSQNVSDSVPTYSDLEHQIANDKARPGKIIVVNDSSSHTSSLVPITVKLASSVSFSTSSGQLAFSFDDARLKLWRKDDGRTSGDQITKDTPYSAGQFTTDANGRLQLWVEAVGGSSAFGDLSLSLSVYPIGYTPTAPVLTDTARITSVQPYAPDAATSGAVRLADGTISLSATDLATAGFGMVFGQSRTWTNQLPFGLYSLSGNHVEAGPPHLIQATASIILIEGSEAEYFDYNKTTQEFTARFGTHDKLRLDGSDGYLLLRPDGTRIRFCGFSESTPFYQRGSFQSATSPGGKITQVVQRAADGRIEEIVRDKQQSGPYESWVYGYNQQGPSQGLLKDVVVRRPSGAGWLIVENVGYTYYTGDQAAGLAHGTAGDLRSATLQYGDGVNLDTYYYRYYTSQNGGADAGRLFMALSPSTFARVSSPDTISDADLGKYATYGFAYDSAGRVANQSIQGAGSTGADGDARGTFSYAYSSNPGAAGGFGDTQHLVLVTKPGGVSDEYALNFAGQMRSQTAAVGTFNSVTSFAYDNAGRLTSTTLPSGLSYGTDYYTTGDWAGYASEDYVRNVALGRYAPLRGYTYSTHQVGQDKIVLPLATTVWPNEANTNGAQITGYDYDAGGWTEFQPKQIKTTPPVVPESQNGSGQQEPTIDYYDAYGRLTKTTDDIGTLHTTAYDLATGAVTLSSAYPTPGGQSLDTTTGVDKLGRPVSVTDPAGNCTSFAHEESAAVQQSKSTPPSVSAMPAPRSVVRRDLATGYTATYTETPSGKMLSLSIDWTDNAGRVMYSDRYCNVSRVNLTAGSFGSVGTDYYRTYFYYDAAGRQTSTKNAVGTITRTVYDDLNRPTETWIGTTDSNQTLVQRTTYDEGGVGDSNPTSVISYPTPSQPRTSRMWYDWRGRLVAEKDGIGGNESAVHPPLTCYTLDNLGQSVATRVYDGTGIGYSGDQADPAPAGRLHSYRQDLYDNQGRVYRSLVHRMDPVYVTQNGAITASDITGYADAGSMASNTWYDARGNVIKQQTDGGPATKMHYDGAGRPDVVYITDAGGDPAAGEDGNWAAAGNVIDDKVVTQTETMYDKDGNPIFVTTRDRFHNATCTGSLATEANRAQARSSYVATFYDAADRPYKTLNYGTYGGQAVPWDGVNNRPVELSRLPASGRDPYLVSEQTYDAAGNVDTTTDPRGIVTKVSHDALGRATRTVEGFTGGIPMNDSDRVVKTVYDGLDRVIRQSQLLPNNRIRTTIYTYGVSTANGSTINDNDLLSSVSYPANDIGKSGTPYDETYTYDALGGKVTKTLKNGLQHSYAFDSLGRCVSDAVTALPADQSVDGTIIELRTVYDSAGQAERFTSINSSGAPANEVLRLYNGFGQVTAEYQQHNGALTTLSGVPVVLYGYGDPSSGSRLESMTYPQTASSPVRTITYHYQGLDAALGRVTYMSDNRIGQLEWYDYLGLGTIVGEYRPAAGLQMHYYGNLGNNDGGDQYTGLDRFGRVVEQLWRQVWTATSLVAAGGTATVTAPGHHLEVGDEVELSGPGVGTYTGRFTVTEKTADTFKFSASGPVSVQGDFTASHIVDWFAYGYDADSNVLYKQNMLALSLSELYQAKGASAADAYDKLNRMKEFHRGTLASTAGSPYPNTLTSEESDWARQYSLDATGRSESDHEGEDAMGNVIQRDRTTWSDAWNRLTVILSPGPADRDSSYQYDALGRMVKYDGPLAFLGGPPRYVAEFYHSLGWQTISEVTVAPPGWGWTTQENVWGLGYVDDLIATQNPAPTTLRFALHDAGHNVTSIMASDCRVAERYLYEPYGDQGVSYRAPSWERRSSQAGSAYGWHYLYKGGSWLGDGLYHFRNREYAPGSGSGDTAIPGHWLQRDPAGTIDGLNLHEFVGSNPVNRLDPTGEYALIDDLLFGGGGAVLSVMGQGANDLLSGQWSGWEAYVGAAAGGAVAGETMLYTANPWLAGAAGGAATNATTQGLRILTGKQQGFGAGSLLLDTGVGALGAALGARIGGRVFRAVLPTSSAVGAAFIAGKVSGAVAGAAMGGIGGFARGGWSGVLSGAGRGAVVGSFIGGIGGIGFGAIYGPRAAAVMEAQGLESAVMEAGNPANRAMVAASYDAESGVFRSSPSGRLGYEMPPEMMERIAAYQEQAGGGSSWPACAEQNVAALTGGAGGGYRAATYAAIGLRATRYGPAGQIALACDRCQVGIGGRFVMPSEKWIRILGLRPRKQ